MSFDDPTIPPSKPPSEPPPDDPTSSEPDVPVEEPPEPDSRPLSPVKMSPVRMSPVSASDDEPDKPDEGEVAELPELPPPPEPEQIIRAPEEPAVPFAEPEPEPEPETEKLSPDWLDAQMDELAAALPAEITSSEAPPPPPPPAPSRIRPLGEGVPVPPPPPPPRADEFEPDWIDRGPADYGGYPFPPQPKRKRAGKGKRYEWHEVWIMAVTQPNTETYEEIIADPQASISRGAMWVFALSIVAAFIQFMFAGLIGVGAGDPGAVAGGGLGLLICAPVAALVSIAFLALGWGLQHVMARLLGGEGTFEEMFYANSAWYVPIRIALLVAIIPCIGWLASFVLGIYGIALNVVAIKAVHGFDWGRSILSAFWVLLFVCACAVCSLMLVGSAMSDVFQNVIDNLITPTPSLIQWADAWVELLFRVG